MIVSPPYHVLYCILLLLTRPHSQWNQKYPAQRRHSNSGHRALELNDRIFLFLTRMRRRMPFETLGILFGISHETARTYYGEMLDLFCENLLGRLVYPLSAAETKQITPAEFSKDLPDVLVIWDATGFDINSKGNVLGSRILYSAYNHHSQCFVVFGRCKGVLSFLWDIV